MIVDFKRIPGLFVETYRAEFEVWGRERAHRARQAIVFRRKPGAPVLLDGNGRPIMAGVWLEAEVDHSLPGAPRVVIQPASDRDAELIERHVRELARGMH